MVNELKKRGSAAKFCVYVGYADRGLKKLTQIRLTADAHGMNVSEFVMAVLKKYVKFA